MPSLRMRRRGGPVDVARLPGPVGRSAGLRAAADQLVPAATGVFAALFTVYEFVLVMGRSPVGLNFHYSFWPAADRVLRGLSPYADPHSPLVAAGKAFVYPAPAAWLFAPFGLLDRDVADVLFTVLAVAAVPVTLWVLEVRDWRAFAVAFLWAPVFVAWLLANVTTLLALGVALAWKHRDRPVLSGVLVAVMVSVKLFLWPLGLWLLATRRYSALAYAVAATLAVNVIAWTALGFGEISRYQRLVSALTRVEERRAYSFISLGLHHGTGRLVAYAIGLGLAAAVMAACVTLGRAGRDASALALALAASVLASPLVWLHYFALLLVPVAIARPRLSPLWCLPVITWFATPTGPSDLELVLVLATAAAVLAGCLRQTELAA